jgi:group I intron endonuclease
MTGIIYCYTNKFNGKKYIGQTTRTLFERAGKDGSKYDRKYKFGQAVEKYSLEAFDVEILETLEAQSKPELRKALNVREKHYISLFDSYRNGYNSDSGGNSHDVSEETKQKISASKLAKQQLPGYRHPNTGKHLAEKTKAKISAAHVGKIPWNKGIIAETPGKAVRCLETGITYISIVAAAVDVGTQPQNIIQALRGKAKTAKKYHWEYV